MKMKNFTCHKLLHVGILPAEDFHEHEGEDDDHEAADAEDELAGEVPELGQEEVEEEREDHAHHGHGQTDRVDVLVKDGLEIDLKKNWELIKQKKNSKLN